MKDGVPSRAEITDAAMSGRAECVMLNKGEYVDDVVQLLDQLLSNMQNLRTKKQSHMPILEAWK